VLQPDFGLVRPRLPGTGICLAKSLKPMSRFGGCDKNPGSARASRADFGASPK